MQQGAHVGASAGYGKKTCYSTANGNNIYQSSMQENKRKQTIRMGFLAVTLVYFISFGECTFLT